ncbi:hypothetical protein ACOSQ3_017627 [Xanthoceras sorbifolium]
MNTDAALSIAKCKTGIGAVLRDHNGDVLLFGVHSLDGVLEPDIAEAKAILFGLTLAMESGFFSLFLESDAASCLNSRVNFFHVPRNANRIAHSLTKLSFDFDYPAVWLEEFPSCISSLIVEDACSIL